MEENTQTTDKTEKTLFVLPDHGKDTTPLSQLDYYLWMKKQGITNPHKITTKREYLQSIGFSKEIHTLGETWENDLKILSHCEDCYYRWEILEKKAV